MGSTPIGSTWARSSLGRATDVQSVTEKVPKSRRFACFAAARWRLIARAPAIPRGPPAPPAFGPRASPAGRGGNEARLGGWRGFAREPPLCSSGAQPPPHASESRRASVVGASQARPRPNQVNWLGPHPARFWGPGPKTFLVVSFFLQR